MLYYPYYLDLKSSCLFLMNVDCCSDRPRAALGKAVLGWLDSECIVIFFGKKNFFFLLSAFTNLKKENEFLL